MRGACIVVSKVLSEAFFYSNFAENIQRMAADYHAKQTWNVR